MLQRNKPLEAPPKLLDVVELRADVEEEGAAPWGGRVKAGAQGTIVEELASGIYLVEFNADENEPTILTLPGDLLLVRWIART